MLAAKLCCMLVCNMNQGGRTGGAEGAFFGNFWEQKQIRLSANAQSNGVIF